MFAHLGVRCVTMSLDDFYLTAEEQQGVARKYMHNPLVQYRGNGRQWKMCNMCTCICRVCISCL
ncbi:hypothetical protein EON65_32325 [archaeon]|nr:MAG: hypothetical protein EON65_32325 [archaeon]